MNTVQRFDIAMDFILKWEKPYLTNPIESAYGLKKPSVPNVDLRSLTVYHAIEIYRKQFWMYYSVDKLPDPLAALFLDTCALYGPLAAVSIQQNSMNNFHLYLARRLEYAALKPDVVPLDHVMIRTADFLRTFHVSSETK